MTLSLTCLQQRARTLKADTVTLYFAARHRRTPWHAKLFMVAIVAYAFSPIDLIPDFVPVLGYLDELILLPVGISLALRMIPPDVVTECRTRANQASLNVRRGGRIAAAVIVMIWIAIGALCIVWFYDGG